MVAKRYAAWWWVQTRHHTQQSCRQHVPTIGRMAAAVGVDGLFIETHDDPVAALCDADTVFPLASLEPLLRELCDIALASRALSQTEERQ